MQHSNAATHLSPWLSRFSTAKGRGLYLLTGANGSGKSRAAAELAASLPGAQLLSAESQQRFYELQLENDEANFNEGVETSSTVSELLGDAGKAHPLFAALRLETLSERSYFKLSTGEGRKVLLLQAVLRKPALLVLDEPFDGLDRAARAELWSAISEAAGALPVVLVGSFEAAQLELEPLTAKERTVFQEVAVIERGAVSFVGTEAAWRARSVAPRRVFRAPPVDQGTFFDLPSRTPLIELRRGTVRYGDNVIFEGLDWTLSPGEHTLIEGPNGSGKSTLLGLVTGDHPQAYANELHLFGRRRGTGESVWDIKRNVGLVSGQLHRDYRVAASVEDVLLSGLYDSIGVYQAPEPSERARARAWLEWLELPVALDASFRELSFGFQRLVLVARAAIKVPPLVVLDEPTTGLDAENRALVLALVESLCRQKKSTVLFVSHRADERTFWNERIAGNVLSLG